MPASSERANGARRFAAPALQRLMNAGLLAFALGGAAAFADSPVLKVKDGDSLVVRSGGHQVEVRLAYIDAPEFKQTHGKRAGAVLRSLVGGRKVRLELIGGDVHRRIVARVFSGNRDVNAEMVRRGFAWVRREFPHPRGLARLEDQARAARRGLWAKAQPIPPWDLAKEQTRQEQSKEQAGGQPVARSGPRRRQRSRPSGAAPSATVARCPPARRRARTCGGADCELSTATATASRAKCSAGKLK